MSNKYMLFFIVLFSILTIGVVSANENLIVNDEDFSKSDELIQHIDDYKYQSNGIDEDITDNSSSDVPLVM